MTIALVTLAVLCVLEMVGTFLIVRALIDRAARAEDAWTSERADLCQRLQAPQHAVAAHYNDAQAGGSPPAVDLEDDEDFWESREQLAERLAAEEVTSG